MFKKMLLAVLAVAALVCGGAEKKSIVPKSTVPGKICLLVTDVGTIDTVAKTEEFLTKIKQFNISNTPSVSDADKAVDPTIAKREVNYRFNDNVRRYNEEQREIARQNRRMERILDNLRTSITGNAQKRDIIVAKNYLQSFLSDYSDYIQVIDRSNTSLAEVEKAINGNDQQNVASACVFLTVIMQDLRQESNTVSIGNTMVKSTKYTQKAVGNLRDFNGNVLTAFHVVATSSRRQTSASRSEGHNPASDLMEAVLKQISEKIVEYYLCELEFKCVGPKGDDEFDADTVTFTVDGKEFQNGEKVLAGKHTVVAEAEGYRPIKKSVVVRAKRKKMISKLVFKKLPPPKAETAEGN